MLSHPFMAALPTPTFFARRLNKVFGRTFSGFLFVSQTSLFDLAEQAFLTFHIDRTKANNLVLGSRMDC